MTQPFAKEIIESTIGKILFLQSMKRLTTLLLLIAWSTSLALNGSRQVHVEELYDTYRSKYLSPLTESKQVETLTKIQTALSQYRQRPGTSTGVKDMVSYLEHLFCHTKSLLTGYYCEDNYRPSSQLTTSKNNFSISELRQLLIQEHSKRRIER